jgi:uncharacterized membrane protein YkvA (DUF1232 family)
MADDSQNQISLECNEVKAASRWQKLLANSKASSQKTWGVLAEFFQEQFSEGRNWLKRTLLIWRLFWKRGVGILPRVILVAAVIYVISPLDFIPVILVDDLGVILLGAKLFLSLTPEELLAEERKKLGLQDGM